MYNAKNMADVRRFNESIGHSYFEDGVMNFFGSRIESELFDNNTFVTSELDAFGKDRRYTVRLFDNQTAEIKDLSTYRIFASLNTALEYAKAYTKACDPVI